MVDIRDPQSFAVGHISGSRHIDNHSVADFIAAADLDAPLVVVCYHGNSSQSAAAYFIQQGFSDVYSLDGGFELWRSVYPADTSSGEAGRPRRYPPKTVTSLAFLPLLRPERTILFLRPSKTGRAGTPASGPSAVTVRSAGGKGSTVQRRSLGILAGLAGGTRTTDPAPAHCIERGDVMSIFSHFQERFEATRQEEYSLQEYLDLCKQDKTAYASAAERLLMAIGEPELLDTSVDSRLSRIFSNKVIRRYPAFADFHGMEECIDQIVAFFRHAAQGLEEKKQILYLLGPVGGGKSSWRKNSSN